MAARRRPVLIVLLGALSSCLAARNDLKIPSEHCGFATNSILTPDTALRQCIDFRDGTVRIEVIRSKQVWLGVGLGSLDPEMKESPFLVGLPETSMVRILNFGSRGANASTERHLRSNVRDARIWQNATHTILSVSLLDRNRRIPESKTVDGAHRHETRASEILVVSGFDNQIGMHEFLLAHPMENDVIGFLVKDQGTESPPAPRRLDEEPTEKDEIKHKAIWSAHACLMTLSWGLFIPLAIGSSIIRNLFSDGVWLIIHKTLNTMSLLLTLVAFALAFYAVRDVEESTDSAQDEIELILENSHRSVGFIVVMLVVIQALTGWLRPQATEESTDVPPEPPNGGGEASTTRESQRNIVQNRSTRRKVWELQHRLLGMGLIAASWYNIHRGISLYEDRFGSLLQDETRSTTEIFWGGVIGLVVSFFVLATIARVFS